MSILLGGKYPPAPHTGLWNPAYIFTEGWYDASDPLTITESSGYVSQWNDKSGIGRHLVQSNGAFQPRTGLRTQNSLNMIDGNGTQWIGLNPFPVNADGNVSLFAMCVVDTVVDYYDGMFAMDGSGADFKLMAGAVGDHSHVFNGYVQGLFGSSFALTGGPFPGPAIYNVEFDKTGSGLVTGRVSGIDRGSTAYSTKLVTAHNFTVLADKSAIYMLDGAVGEVIIVHDDLTLVTRQKIEGYLAWKWGTQANLDAGHPYKAAAPTA